MGLRLIVIGVDGSVGSRRAVGWVADLASATGAEVLAVHSLGLLEHMGPGRELVPVESHQGEIATAPRDDWCTPLRGAGVRYRTELIFGPPVSALLGAADRERADLLVVGSRRQAAATASALGSTSRELVSRASIPTVVIPVGR